MMRGALETALALIMNAIIGNYDDHYGVHYGVHYGHHKDNKVEQSTKGNEYTFSMVVWCVVKSLRL